MESSVEPLAISCAIITKTCFFCDQRFFMRQGVEIAIKSKIQEHGRGWCFTAMDFEDLGSNDAIRRVLSILQKEKWIRRLAQD